MAMRAGRLRHRGDIEQYTVLQNETGEPEKEWAPFAVRWMSIDPIEGREFWAAQQVNAEVTHRIRLRYLEGLSPKMRIVFQGRVFQIDSVRNLSERRTEMEVMAIERVNGVGA